MFDIHEIYQAHEQLDLLLLGDRDLSSIGAAAHADASTAPADGPEPNDH